MLHHYDGGRLEVDTEGTVTYYPRPNKITEQLLPERDLQYVLRHNADIIVESVDPENNSFRISCKWKTCLEPVNGTQKSFFFQILFKGEFIWNQ
jgi:hypothetical protein